MFREVVEREKGYQKFLLKMMTATFFAMLVIMTVLAVFVIKTAVVRVMAVIFVCGAGILTLGLYRIVQGIDARVRVMCDEAGAVSDADMDAMMQESKVYGKLYLSGFYLLDFSLFRTFRRSLIENVRLTARNKPTENRTTYLNFDYEGKTVVLMRTDDAQNRALFTALTGKSPE